MSAAQESAGQGTEDRLTKYLRLLEEVGLTPTLRVRQLLAAGFPAAALRTHFPDLPDSAFITPAPDAQRLPPITRPNRTAGRAAQGAPASAALGSVLQRLAERTAAASASLATTPALPRTLGVPGATQMVSQFPSQNIPKAAIPAQNVLSDGISFQYVPLIQCSFPHMDPGAATHFSRRNGWLELTLSTARPDTGLPYGVPARLLTMYCASEAIRTRSPEVFLGASLHEFLRRLEVPITRGDRGSLRVYANQLLRLAHCALSIDENVRDAGGRTGLHIRQALFVEEARLWWDEITGVGQGSTLVLSPVLYESILERSAPLSTKVIRQLRKSPMDLDVYAWLVHRLFALNRPSTVTWEQLSGQFGHGYTLLRKFRAFFSESLKRVQEAYPEANLKVTEAGVTLLPSRPHIPRDALIHG